LKLTCRKVVSLDSPSVTTFPKAGVRHTNTAFECLLGLITFSASLPIGTRQSINDWNVVNPASRRDAQLFNMHTQAFLATPVKICPLGGQCRDSKWTQPVSIYYRTLHKKASNSICLRLKLMLRTGTGFAIACIVDAKCEKTLIGGFSRTAMMFSGAVRPPHQDSCRQL
jgi:hypothetical protein